MTDLTFHNAPLVEIVAELRWPSQVATPLPQLPGASPGPQPTLFLGTAQLEDFFFQFGAEVYKLGFQQMERLIPGGFPVPQGQAVCRFRSREAAKTTVLYQVGLGMFSANATPPYRSWASFAPEVEKGVAVLLATRHESERATLFNPVTLRYIDVFREDLTGGRSSAAFLSEILKFGLALPDAILNHRAPNRSHESFLMLTVPLTNGTLRLNVGDAIVSGTKAILLDTTFSTENMIEPTAVMATLGSAHSVIHDIFMQLTKPIHQLMQPEQ